MHVQVLLATDGSDELELCGSLPALPIPDDVLHIGPEPKAYKVLDRPRLWRIASTRLEAWVIIPAEAIAPDEVEMNDPVRDVR